MSMSGGELVVGWSDEGNWVMCLSSSWPYVLHLSQFQELLAGLGSCTPTLSVSWSTVLFPLLYEKRSFLLEAELNIGLECGQGKGALTLPSTTSYGVDSPILGNAQYKGREEA